MNSNKFEIKGQMFFTLKSAKKSRLFRKDFSY